MWRKCFSARPEAALAIAAALGAGVLGASQANAALTLVISSSAAPSGPIIIPDNGGLDSNPAPGQITTFTFGIGGYSLVNINAVFSNDPGSLNGASLQVTNIVQRDAITPGAPTLTIEASDEGYFIPTGGGLSLNSSGGGTISNSPGAGSLTFESFADDTNVLFGTGTATPLHATGTPGSLTPVNYSFGPVPTPFAAVGTYSMYNRTAITLSSPDSQSNFSGTTTVVPEPAALGLLGVASIALVGRRRNA